eukprot:764928-Hanusia_phi.AAC.2
MAALAACWTKSEYGNRQFSEGLKIQNSTGNRVIVEYITSMELRTSTDRQRQRSASYPAVP